MIRLGPGDLDRRRGGRADLPRRDIAGCQERVAGILTAFHRRDRPAPSNVQRDQTSRPTSVQYARAGEQVERKTRRINIRRLGAPFPFRTGVYGPSPVQQRNLYPHTGPGHRRAVGVRGSPQSPAAHRHRPPVGSRKRLRWIRLTEFSQRRTHGLVTAGRPASFRPAGGDPGYRSSGGPPARAQIVADLGCRWTGPGSMPKTALFLGLGTGGEQRPAVAQADAGESRLTAAGRTAMPLEQKVGTTLK